MIGIPDAAGYLKRRMEEEYGLTMDEMKLLYFAQRQALAETVHCYSGTVWKAGCMARWGRMSAIITTWWPKPAISMMTRAGISLMRPWHGSAG